MSVSRGKVQSRGTAYRNSRRLCDAELCTLADELCHMWHVYVTSTGGAVVVQYTAVSAWCRGGVLVVKPVCVKTLDDVLSVLLLS